MKRHDLQFDSRASVEIIDGVERCFRQGLRSCRREMRRTHSYLQYLRAYQVVRHELPDDLQLMPGPSGE